MAALVESRKRKAKRSRPKTSDTTLQMLKAEVKRRVSKLPEISFDKQARIIKHVLREMRSHFYITPGPLMSKEIESLIQKYYHRVDLELVEEYKVAIQEEEDMKTADTTRKTTNIVKLRSKRKKSKRKAPKPISLKRKRKSSKVKKMKLSDFMIEQYPWNSKSASLRRLNTFHQECMVVLDSVAVTDLTDSIASTMIDTIRQFIQESEDIAHVLESEVQICFVRAVRYCARLYLEDQIQALTRLFDFAVRDLSMDCFRCVQGCHQSIPVHSLQGECYLGCRHLCSVSLMIDFLSGKEAVSVEDGIRYRTETALYSLLFSALSHRMESLEHPSQLSLFSVVRKGITKSESSIDHTPKVSSVFQFDLKYRLSYPQSLFRMYNLGMVPFSGWIEFTRTIDEAKSENYLVPAWSESPDFEMARVIPDMLAEAKISYFFVHSYFTVYLLHFVPAIRDAVSGTVFVDQAQAFADDLGFIISSFLFDTAVLDGRAAQELELGDEMNLARSLESLGKITYLWKPKPRSWIYYYRKIFPTSVLLSTGISDLESMFHTERPKEEEEEKTQSMRGR